LAGINDPHGPTINIQPHQPPISGMTEFDPVAPVTTAFFEYGLWLVPIVIGLAALRDLLLPRIKGGIGETLIGKALDGLFDEVLHDIIVPDGRGGFAD